MSDVIIVRSEETGTVILKSASLLCSSSFDTFSFCFTDNDESELTANGSSNTLGSSATASLECSSTIVTRSSFVQLTNASPSIVYVARLLD